MKSIQDDTANGVWLLRPPLGYADPAPYARERVWTPATVVTAVRTVAAVGLAIVAAQHQQVSWLVAALIVYWVGDSLDGAVARWLRCETRTGAVLDILSDRLCAAGFYGGLAFLQPDLALPALLYLANFVVIDCFVSLAFLQWPLRSPNYFYVVDVRLWQWNWSHPGKALNSALFAVLLLATGWVWVAALVAVMLIVIKSLSLARLLRIGLPVPSGS